VLSVLLDGLPEDVRKPLISVVLPTLADVSAFARPKYLSLIFFLVLVN
jgi:hypothetical protein